MATLLTVRSSLAHVGKKISRPIASVGQSYHVDGRNPQVSCSNSTSRWYSDSFDFINQHQHQHLSSSHSTIVPTFPHIATKDLLSVSKVHHLDQHRAYSSTSIQPSPDEAEIGGISPSLIHNYTEDVKSMTNEELLDPTTIPGYTTLIHSPARIKIKSTKEKDNIEGIPTIPRNALIGKVVSDKMQKTVNVAVDRYHMVRKYRKRKKYTRKFMAHDEFEKCNEGDLVMIVPCQKLSRHKHFRVHEIIKRKGQVN